MRTAPSTSMWNPLRAVRITRFKLQCGTESGSATSWLWLQHFTTRSGCQIHKMGPRGLAGPVPSAFWADRMEALQAGTLSETGSSEGGGITRCGACLVCVLFADWGLGSQDSCLYALAWDRNVSLRPFSCHQLSDTPGPIKIGLPGREGLQRDRAAVHRLGTSSRLHPLVASFFFFTGHTPGWPGSFSISHIPSRASEWLGTLSGPSGPDTAASQYQERK